MPNKRMWALCIPKSETEIVLERLIYKNLFINLQKVMYKRIYFYFISQIFENDGIS